MTHYIPNIHSVDGKYSLITCKENIKDISQEGYKWIL